MPENSLPNQNIQSDNKLKNNTEDRIILIILGTLEIILPLIFSIFIFPQLIKLNNGLKITDIRPYIGIIFNVLLIIIGFSQIIIGIFRNKLKVSHKKVTILIITGIIFGLLTIPIIIFSVVMPIYNTLSSITDAPTSPNPQQTSTSDETSDWKTYTNSERKYSFKYPASYAVKSSQKTSTTAENVTLEKDVEVIKDGGMGGGDVLSKGLIIRFTIWPKKDLSDSAIKNQFGTNAEISKINFGGKEFTKVILEDSSTRYFYVYSPEVLEINEDIGFSSTDMEKNNYLNEYNQILSTFTFAPLSTSKFTDSASNSSTQNYLNIPEFGVKITLTVNIKDAYSTPIKTQDKKSWVYLKVHSLDSEPYCNDYSSLGIAALSKVGKDEIDERTGKKFSESDSGIIIGNYYYYMELSQAVCSEKSTNQTIEANARKAFSETKITSL